MTADPRLRFNDVHRVSLRKGKRPANWWESTDHDYPKWAKSIQDGLENTEPRVVSKMEGMQTTY